MVGIGLLVLSVGLSSIISLGLCIGGIVVSRRGMRRIQRGETTKNKGLAQAGFWSGIVGTFLASVATLGLVALIIALSTDDSFRKDFFDEDDATSDDFTILLLRLGTALVRLVVTG
jgi:hypothetical protein